jgi:NitT/TauT family transport system substrate-binding protein
MNFPRRAFLKRRDFLQIFAASALLGACSKSSKIRLALNWKPDPEFGGFYAADYPKHRLDVEILPGGSGTPTVQMIGAGSAEFGIIQADELLLARAQGNDVVALFAAFRNSPLAIMAHGSRKVESIGDVLKNGTLGIESGLSYAHFLKQKFGFDHVKVVPSPGGDLTAFLHDENFAQQCFVMDEPLQARRKGVDVKVFPISDIGYNPYTTVMATSGDLLRKNPDMAKNMVAAVREGWRAYLDNAGPTNEKLHAINPSMEAADYAEIAEAQKPLIESSPLGTMTAERWDTLAAQLKEIGDIPKAPPADQCFRDL